MKVIIKQLVMQQFKSHENMEIGFSELTKISGRNGIGKSSIGEAITWLFFGVDTLGVKADPTPLGAADEIQPSVAALIEWQAEGGEPVQTLFAKKLVKGKAAYFINDVPEKATAFDDATAQLFGKDYFLACFNPLYFFSQHWKEQRAQLLQYVAEPLDADVLAAIADKGKAEALAKATEKRSVSDVVKVFKPIYASSSTQYERASERWITLKEQFAKAQGQSEDLDAFAVDEEKRTLEAQLANASAINQQAQDQKRAAAKKEFEMAAAMKEIYSIKDKVLALQAQVIAESCGTCGQDLNPAAIQKTLDNKQLQIDKLSSEGRAKMNAYKERQAEPAEPVINAIDTAAAQSRLYSLTSALETAARLKPLAEEVRAAEANKEKIRQEYLQAQEILEAAKLFETAKSEVMAQKVAGLFTNLSVSLENVAKNGSRSPSFEVEWQGRPYSKLSTAERIKAGLELINVLADQSGAVLPVFIDNAESIITFSKPAGQTITATVKNSHLVIKNEGEENND